MAEGGGGSLIGSINFAGYEDVSISLHTSACQELRLKHVHFLGLHSAEAFDVTF